MTDKSAPDEEPGAPAVPAVLAVLDEHVKTSYGVQYKETMGGNTNIELLKPWVPMIQKLLDLSPWFSQSFLAPILVQFAETKGSVFIQPDKVKEYGTTVAKRIRSMMRDYTQSARKNPKWMTEHRVVDPSDEPK